MATTNEHRPSRRLRVVEPADTRGPIRRAHESGDQLVGAAHLLARCGTIDDLEALDAAELPVEPFAWESVVRRDQRRVAGVLEHVETVCADHLDDEYLTVLRRLLAFAAAHPEHPLRTRTEPRRLAAALTWIALVGNLDGRIAGRGDSSAVWWWFDVTSCARLARSLATTLGFRPEPRFGEPVGWSRDGGVYLKNADLLHSRCRRRLIAQREQLAAGILEREERQRLSRPMVSKGSTVEMHAVETDFATALKIAPDGGRQMVMLGLGESSTDPDHLFALSVPETHRMVTALQQALHSVAALGSSPPSR